MSEWKTIGERNGWGVRPAHWFFRLPVVRHVRAVYHGAKVDRHNAICRSIGMIPTGSDEWILEGIWRGYA
jgi:hypothetical protein